MRLSKVPAILFSVAFALAGSSVLIAPIAYAQEDEEATEAGDAATAGAETEDADATSDDGAAAADEGAAATDEGAAATEAADGTPADAMADAPVSDSPVNGGGIPSPRR